MRASIPAFLLFAWPALAWSQQPEVDARLRTEIVAVTPLDTSAPETDLDLDSRLDLGFRGLLLPELAGRLALRDRRDLNEPRQGSVLRDAWDAREGRDQERLEQAWLEFGDRLALRAGRQVEWAGASVRYDGASLRLRRLGEVVEVVAFGGRRARLDALDGEEDELVPVVGGRLDLQFGQISVHATSLYVDAHLLEIELGRRLRPRRVVFDELRFRLGYSQLGLAPRDAFVGAETTLRRLPVRLFLTAEARLTRNEDEFLFDYTTVQSEAVTHDMRLHLEPLAPGIRIEARAQVRPIQLLTTSLLVARRQLFEPSETTTFSYSYNEIAVRADVIGERGGGYASFAASLWLPDLGAPPNEPTFDSTSGEGQRQSLRLMASVGLRVGRLLDASLGVVRRSFDYVSARARLDGVDALSFLLRVSLRPVSFFSLLAWGAYDEAVPVLDQDLTAAAAAGLRLEVSLP